MIKILEATVDDLKEIFALIQAVGQEKSGEDTFAYSTDISIYERILRNNYCLVAKDGNSVIASFLTFSQNEDIEGVYGAFDIDKMNETIILETCQVYPEYRGGHLQLQMGKKILEYAKNRYKYAICTVSPDNKASLKTLQRLGFSVFTDTTLYGKRRFLMMKVIER